MSPEEQFYARHAACTDDPNPEIATEMVFTLQEGRLYLNIHGYGQWPGCKSLVFPPLTKEATRKVLAYLAHASAEESYTNYHDNYP